MSSAATLVLPETTTLQQRKQQLVRDAIWDAAIDLFAERGYDETTVDDIAARAGVSRRSFFRYFSSKGDIMAAGLAQYGTILADAIDGQPRGQDVAAVFQNTVAQVASRCAAYPRVRKAMQVIGTHPAASAAQQTRSEELRRQVTAAYARRKRTLGGLEPAVLAGLTLATLQVVFQEWFTRESTGIEETAHTVLRALSRLA